MVAVFAVVVVVGAHCWVFLFGGLVVCLHLSYSKNYYGEASWKINLCHSVESKCDELTAVCAEGYASQYLSVPDRYPDKINNTAFPLYFVVLVPRFVKSFQTKFFDCYLFTAM